MNTTFPSNSQSPEDTEIVALKKQVREEFALAEKKIKRLDRKPIGLLVPPVNELRYCAFHLVRAQSPETGENIMGELKKAINHCHRAIHDCIEMEFLYNLKMVQKFQDDYKNDYIAGVFLEYHDMSALAVEARDYVVKRSNNSISDEENKLREDSDELVDPYREFLKISNNLNSLVERLPTVRDQLNTQINATRKKTLFTYGAIVVATVSAVFAALTFFFSK